MNNRRRSYIDKSTNYLELALDMLRDIFSEEQDSYNNLPENLQDSERDNTMKDCIQSLEDAIDSIEEAIDYLKKARG